MKKTDWYKELDSHIRCIHNVTKQRKTILVTGPHLYQVVTRVNRLSLDLWLDHANKIVATLKSDKFEKQRFCWLTEQKQYRREFMQKLANHQHENLNP